MEKIDLDNLYSSENSYLVPKYIDSKTSKRILDVWKSLGLNGHIFIFSSGTSNKSSIKTYAISKSSILANAKAVNRFLDLKSEDNLLLSISPYHIGGLSILFRAKVSGAKVFPYLGRWNPEVLFNYCKSEGINYLSLVPTQMYDLVKLNFSCPSSIKGVFVGGDFISKTLLKSAMDLKWPVILTYGATELSSQIATSFARDVKDGFLKVLDIHKVYLKDEVSYISSPSLFSKEIILNQNDFIITDANEEFPLPDYVELISKNDAIYLKPLGRITDELKIKGRLLNFLNIKDYSYSLFAKLDILYKADIQVAESHRLGKEILIILEKSESDKSTTIINKISDQFDRLFIPKVILVDKLELTTSGKIKKINLTD